MMTCPIVRSRNRCFSSGISHGIRPLFPIIWFYANAAINASMLFSPVCFCSCLLSIPYFPCCDKSHPQVFRYFFLMEKSHLTLFLIWKIWYTVPANYFSRQTTAAETFCQRPLLIQSIQDHLANTVKCLLSRIPKHKILDLLYFRRSNFFPWMPPNAYIPAAASVTLRTSRYPVRCWNKSLLTLPMHLPW